MFVDFFIKRPVFATVCAILITLLGAVSIPTLPIAQYPSLGLPQVGVSSFYTGASAEVVESAVTTPLEQEINGVPGMRSIESSSSSDGSSQISVTFDVDRDIDLAAVDVQNRVNTVSGRLPNEVKQAGIAITKNSGSFVLAAALSTDDGRYDQKFISNYADVYMRDALKRVAGVSSVQIFGERRFSMRIWLDPVRLASRQLTAADVVAALQEQNVQVAAGAVGLQPAPSGQAYQFSIRAMGRLVEPSEFEAIVLRSATDGSLVRLRDVGRAELGAESYGDFLRFDGKVAVGLGITQLPGANALDVARRVTAELARLSEGFPPGLRYHIAFDTTLAVSQSIREVLATLGEAIALVIAVIFVFLQSFRVTVIPAITIPVSLIGTFAFVKLFGFSINTLTLFGITLATGLVVDDAIVVIENVSRFIEEKGLAPQKAASAGVSEVFGAVIATSLVLVAVFVPVAFFPGTTGRIYQQFSLTIAFSVGISTFNSLTLSPALAALLLRPAHERKGWFFRGVDRALAALRGGYVAMLTRLVRRRGVTALAFAACLGATYALVQRVPTGFVPEEDSGYFIVIVQGPEGSSLAATEVVVKETEAALQKETEIAGVFSVGGFSFGGSSPNRAILFVNLRPWEERKGEERSLASVIGRLRGPLGAISGAMVFPFAPPSIDGVGNFGGFQLQLEDQSAGGKLEDLARAASALMEAGNKAPALSGVYASFTANDPQLTVEVDRDKAKALGVSVSQIFETLQVFTGSQYVNDFDYGGRTYRVYVQADQPYRANPKDLTQFYVRAASGAMVPLGSVIRVVPSTTAPVISHFNLFRSTEVSGSPAPGVSSGEALAAMEEIARKALPRGMSFEWSGISREQIESGNKAAAIFALGLLFVFLVLAAQYESFALPFVVVLAVPLAVLGALGAQLLRGYANDVFCQIGLVMLIGLASKNAILIVEFAHQLRDRGAPVVEAAIEAAGTRLRPILMTSLAFLLGVLPLLVATGAGSGSRRSLGTAVFGGMLVSTVMNLFFIPVVYVLLETARERLRGKGKKAEPVAEGGEGEPLAGA
jgi:hydrophobic/amphiphilic exporter-1 (mainly G- bacteria), HAE1 family